MADSGSLSGVSLRKLRKQIAAMADPGSPSCVSLKKLKKQKAEMPDPGSPSAASRKKLNKQKPSMADSGSSLGIHCMKLKEDKEIMSQERTISFISIKEMMDRETSIHDVLPVPLHSPDLTTYANLALYHYNYHANTKYVLSKLLSAGVNGNFCALYDFTFEAAERGNPDGPAFRKFQAKVMREWPHYNLEVCLCRLTNDKKVASDRPKGKRGGF